MKHLIKSGLAAAAGLLVTTGAANAAVYFEQVTPNAVSYELGTDFRVFNFSAEAAVTGTLMAPTVSSFGCAAADYTGFTAGRIALVARGTCFFQEKEELAAAAGAIGIIVYNDPTRPFGGVSFGLPSSTPGIYVTNELGLELLGLMETSDVVVRFDTTPDPVPLPAAAVLFVPALAGLGWARRRRA